MFKEISYNGIKYLKFTPLKMYGFNIIFTTRQGGVSEPPYDSLNLGFHTKDDYKNVKKNRELIYNALNYSNGNIVYGEQIHSNKIKLITDKDKGRGVDNPSNALKNVDGLISTKSDIVLAGHFADCVPIYIVDSKQKYFSLVHSGWQGTYKLILSKAISFFKENLKSKTDDLFVVLGPAISGEVYEVSKDLIDKFKLKFKFTDSYYKNINNKYYLDLKAINRLIALNNDIKEENLYISKLCTYKRDDLFYSYRRDQGQTGRMTAFISHLKN